MGLLFEQVCQVLIMDEVVAFWTARDNRLGEGPSLSTVLVVGLNPGQLVRCRVLVQDSGLSFLSC